ncbi:MAG: serine/threonine-protein kinase [Bryobacteraceae bacterium]
MALFGQTSIANQMNHEVRLLFHEILDLSPRDRERIFRDRHIGPELRAEVESLLSFDSTAAGSLGDLVASAADDLLNSEGLDFGYCGPYRLVRLLGSGGMGAVYMAERTDGEIQQKVAVKLLRGDGHRAVWRERFLRERQLLASLNHPSIVHVIDAGHMEDGKPYLVMEYVEGVPIDVYAAGISVRERLELFVRMCDGVSHAHRRLIIHRDLKPSNILVDSSGRPKLLDFGIARLLDETSDATQTLERLLTPNYASPEQLAGTAQTTATDVYSLGAVLYKLLVGMAPREKVAETPNAEVTAPSSVNSDVPKDIDFIVRKALRTEPEERYLSVDELAGDIRAALGWRPVKARSGDLGYRLRRFLRRYWVPLTAAALVMVSLALGLYVANRERAIAERRFVDVRQLANKLFDIDAQVMQFPGSAKTRQLIVDTSLDYLRRVTANVHMDSTLALELGGAYMRVARVQGVNISANLGQTDQAEQNERRAEALIDSVLATEPGNPAALLRSAQISHDRMILAGDGNRNDEALRFAQKAEGRLDQYLKIANPTGASDRNDSQQAIIGYINVANRYRIANRYDDTLRACRRAIDLAHATNWPHQAGAAMMVVAFAHRENGDLDEALKAVQEAVRILEPEPGEGRTSRRLTYALALSREGQILGEDDAISLGRSREAVDCLQRSFQIGDDIARRDAIDFQSNFNTYATESRLAAIIRHKDPSRALQMYDDGLVRLGRTKDHAAYRRNQATALTASVYPLLQLGNRVEARKRLDLVFDLLGQLKSYPAKQIEPGSAADRALRARASFEMADGNVQRASEIYKDLLQRILAANPRPETNLQDALDLSNIYRAAAPVYRQAGNAGEARTLEARRLEIWQGWTAKFPGRSFLLRQLGAAR